MKPVYLEFCGINSFSEKAVIDFRSLLAGGVFGIFGDTGSGKSTILDSIHLALYGQIERSSGSECINYNLDSAYVIFDFEITTDGVRHAYRVKRERKRKNNTSKAWLYEYAADGGLFALAEGTRDVNVKLEEIIGLTFADFKMCIALPQGDFAALVKAATSERVKLVSRLFDLEKYGERLFKAVSEKYYKADEEVNLVKAKMEQNDGGSVEVIEEKQAMTDALKTTLVSAEETLKAADAAYRNAETLAREKNAYEALGKELVLLLEKLPAMEQRRADLERIPFAKAVAREAAVLETNRRAAETAKRLAMQAEENRKNAEFILQRLKGELEESKYDEKILETSLALEKVRGAEAEIKAEAEAEANLQKCKDEYRELEKKYPQFDYGSAIKTVEGEIAALGGDDNLLDYLKHNCKDVFLGEAYAEFRADLRELSEKYPSAGEGIAVLIEKYTPSKTDARVIDIAQMHADFKLLELKRKTLKKKLEELERQNGEYLLNEKNKEDVKKRGKLYRELWEAAKAKNAFIKALGTLSELENTLKRLQTEKNSAQEKIDKTQEKVNFFRAEAEKQNALFEKGKEEEKTVLAALEKALEESGFADAEEAKTLLRQLGDEATAKADCKRFFDKYELTKHKLEETDTSRFVGFDDNALARAREEKLAAQSGYNELQRRIATAETELKHLIERREKYKAFEKELGEKEKARNLLDELRTLLKGNRFLEYIASEYLQDICLAASKTLLSLTGGRYFLKYEKEFKVGDNLDGGNLRAVKTLSGGETFLVSLSLALSLSAAICQKSLRPIEFFFLDEGFGTLDEKLVETVMDVLGKLSKSFAVGLISHVEELKHRIDNKIVVTGANEHHGSVARMECF